MKATGAPVAAWRALTPDGIAHAFERRRSGQAYCGVPNQPERHDWPAKSRCEACEATVG